MTGRRSGTGSAVNEQVRGKKNNNRTISDWRRGARRAESAHCILIDARRGRSVFERRHTRRSAVTPNIVTKNRWLFYTVMIFSITARPLV